MILDRLANSQKYEALHPRFQAAFQFLRQFDASTFTPGRYELDGANLYYLLQEYTPKPITEGALEAHRNYVDIQYILAGEEFIGYADLTTVQPGDYQPEKDFIPAQGRFDPVRVRAGSFMLLFPNDAHAPGLATGAAGMVQKIVVKVRV